MPVYTDYETDRRQGRARSRSFHGSQYEVVSVPRRATATEVVITPTTVQTVATGRNRSKSRSALLRETITTTYPEEPTDVVVINNDGRSRSRRRDRSISVARRTNKYGESKMELRRSKSRGPKDTILVATKRRESEVRRSIERSAERGYYDEDDESDGEDDFIYESRSRSASVIDRRRSRSRFRGRRRQLDDDDEKLIQEYRVEGIRRAPSRSRWVKQKAKTIIRIAIDLVEPSALQSLSASVREVFDDEVVLTYNRQMTQQDVIDIYLTIAYDGRDSDEDYELSCHNEQSVDEYILKDVRTSNYSPSPRRRTPTRYIDGSTVRLLRDEYNNALMPISSEREIARERSLSRPGRSQSRPGRSQSRRRRSIVRKTRPTPPPVESYRFPDEVPRAEFAFPSDCTAHRHTIKHYECSCYDNSRSWDLLDRIRVIQEKASRILEIPDIERTRDDYEDIYRYRAELEFRIKEVITIRRTLYERARAGRDRPSNRGTVLSGTFGGIGSDRAYTIDSSGSSSEGYFPGRRITRRESTYFEERDSGRSISRPRRIETAPVLIRGRESDYDLEY